MASESGGWRNVCVILFAFAFAGWPQRVDAQRSNPSRATKLRQLKGFKQRHLTLRKAFAKNLEAIAGQCDAGKLSNEAAALRRLANAVQTQPIGLQSLPRTVQPEVPRTLSKVNREWRIAFRKAKAKYANAVYTLARDVLYAGFPSLAYDLVRETAYYHSDHIAARRLLGEVRSGDRWVTPFEKRKAEKGEVWHDKYGWLPKSYVARYEKGEEFYVAAGASKGVWKKASVVEALRGTSIEKGWVVKTEHFRVKTNHSLAKGAEIAKKLEEFHSYFFQIFAGFFNSRAQIKRLFGGGPQANVLRRPYTVHYYRTKDEYVKKLKAAIPRIKITNGLYLVEQSKRELKRLGRVAHFFHIPGVDNMPTLYHEASHQFFYESLPGWRMIAEKSHFWIVEGIACYIESFNVTNGKVQIGTPTYSRFARAKIRLVKDKYFVPMSEFTAMGIQHFQTHPKIYQNYSQAAGMAKFFMEYDGGKYRDALIEHISQIYRGKRTRVSPLPELTGVSYKTLDRQYQEYIRSLPIRIRLQ